MSWERALLILFILVLAVGYYWLAGLALRDLLRRPAVRGDNKVAWGLVIVCLPYIGALIYGYMGAASFLPRTPPSVSTIKGTARSLADRRPANRTQDRP
jgi:Phospholipase_D-nuclease N-terminal